MATPRITDSTHRIRKDAVRRARRLRCVQYAARLHRAQRRPGVYWFKVCTGVRGYLTPADRVRGIGELKAQGYNHFVPFRDVNAEYALQFGKAEWVPAGQAYVDRCPW